jgi:TRAP-type uncharacterized transport system fused permease subunit
VSSLDNQSLKHRGLDWPGIVKTLLIQVLVLLALSAAIVGYLNWSSDVAWTEFIAASTSSVSEPRPYSRSSIPVQTVRDKTHCHRSA